MKYKLSRYSSVITNALGFFINTIGLVLSIVGAIPGNNSRNEQLIIFLIAIAEAFLIIATIHSVVTIFRNYHTRETIDEKNMELSLLRNSANTIVENFTTSVSFYKDFEDRLQAVSIEHCKRFEDSTDMQKQTEGLSDEALQLFFNETQDAYLAMHEDALIDLFNRFHVGMINTLRVSIERYLLTKDCHKNVAIAIKQLDIPTKYAAIEDRKSNIYTAFRDTRTYQMKKRSETWEKTFCIKKNSDFEFSIDKDYYIFNAITREEYDNNLYLNENSNYHEHYNSGVTCTINLCVGQEKMLYGFLACDALFDKNDVSRCGRAIFDDTVANMMMATAHLIALFMSDFLECWKQYSRYRMQSKQKKDHVPMATEDDLEEYLKDNNICKVMSARVRKSRSPF